MMVQFNLIVLSSLILRLLKASADSLSLMLPQNMDAQETKFTQSCQSKYPMTAEWCSLHDQDRFQRINSLRALKNYTQEGFQVVRLPDSIKIILQKFWDQQNTLKTVEIWNAADIHTNHWESSTFTLHLDTELMQSITDSIGAIMQEWTKLSLQPIMTYGIRIFQQDAIIPSHLDRFPFVFTAMINVAQDVDEDWKMLITSQDGSHHHVSIQPGEAIVYESLLVTHGQPYPLKGRFFAAFYIHFMPLYYPILEWKENSPMYYTQTNIENAYNIKRQALVVQTKTSIHDSVKRNGRPWDARLPHYIVPESHEAKRWKQQLKYAHLQSTEKQPRANTSAAHLAAIYNDLRTLKRIAKVDKPSLFAGDENGWQPIHEASRLGNTKVIKYLLQQGADVNSRTHEGAGSSPMHIAIEALGKEHATVKFLEQNGGMVIAPQWLVGEQPLDPKNSDSNKNPIEENDVGEGNDAYYY